MSNDTTIGPSWTTREAPATGRWGEAESIAGITIGTQEAAKAVELAKREYDAIYDEMREEIAEATSRIRDEFHERLKAANCEVNRTYRVLIYSLPPRVVA